MDLPPVHPKFPSTQNLALGLCLTVIAAACTSTRGSARLTQVNEKPCFSVEDTAENRRHPPLLRDIAVYDIGQKPAKEVWGFGIPRALQPVLQPGTCIQYGQLPSGAEETSPSAQLEFGIVYDAAINAVAEPPTTPIHIYTVKFCLIKNAAGRTLVHEIQWDEKQDRWRYDVCKR
jgi:hypothetical protein